MKDAKWKRIGLYTILAYQVIRLSYHYSLFGLVSDKMLVEAWLLSGLAGIIFGIINLMSYVNKIVGFLSVIAIILSGLQMHIIMTTYMGG